MTNLIIPLKVRQLRTEANICPHLCLSSDDRTSASYPRKDHVCKLAGNALVTLDWQRRYCLEANHQRCRTFHFPEFYRPANTHHRLRATRQNPLRVGLIAGLGMMVFLAVTLVALEGVTRQPDADQATSIAQPPAIRLVTTEAFAAARDTSQGNETDASASATDRGRLASEAERNLTFDFSAVERTDSEDELIAGVGGVNTDEEQSHSPGDEHSGTNAANDNEESPEEGASHDPQRHVIQPGETLWVIAQQYGVTVDSIMLSNGLDNPDHIQAGLELVIP